MNMLITRLLFLTSKATKLKYELVLKELCVYMRD
jgi:hypothetical protein